METPYKTDKTQWVVLPNKWQKIKCLFGKHVPMIMGYNPLEDEVTKMVYALSPIYKCLFCNRPLNIKPQLRLKNEPQR